MTQFDDAIAHAQAHEVAWTRDPHAEPLRYGVHHDDPPPWNRLHGPVHARGPVSGQVWIGGELRQSWGEPERADQTFSVAKTYLALLAGVAHGRGLLPDADEPVVRRLPGIGFDSEHNRSITWAHLLSQTSEWEGSCFGIPDQVDRYRKLVLDPKPVQGQKGDARPLQTPGTYWEYNDVRINQLSLALLHLFGQALPQVFEQSILHPIGGGKGFRWEGYEQSWVDLPALNGQAPQRVASVPGGSHWGGGVCISTTDQARVAQLVLNQGQWLVGGQQRALVPSAWIERMRQPQALAPFYGWLNWLNPQGKAFPGASEGSQFMFGAGGNYVWIEPAHQAVVVVRWIDPAHFPGFVSRMARALADFSGGR